MSTPSLINLRKDVAIVLQKKAAPKIRVQVGAAFDISGSAEPIYRGKNNSVMESVVSRSFAVAMEFDDNGSLDSWAFHNETFELTPATEAMFGNYVQKHVIEALGNDLWGGTSFSPLVQAIKNHYLPSAGNGPSTRTVEVSPAVYEQPGFFAKLFGGKQKLVKAAVTRQEPISMGVVDTAPAIDPAYVMIYTDGENGDTGRTEQMFAAFQGLPIFFMFVGINSGSQANFSFIESMSKKFGNVGFFDAKKIQDMTNQDLYSNLISDKFIAWYKTKKA